MRILVTAPYNEAGLKELENNFGEVIYRPWKINDRAYNETELLALLYETEADALITEHDTVSRNVIQANGHLQFIGVCRGTPSNVDITAASENGIPVFFTPARNAQAVAEMFIANVITFMRGTVDSMEWLKSRKWTAGAHTSYIQFKGSELAGKTVGLVGFGAIGQLIARLIEPFPCKILFYDPFIKSNAFPAYEQTGLENLFSTADIVSIHLPVNAETIGMIGMDLLKLMKPEALLVNTARAIVVDREDLYTVLSQNRIRGAILDVFDKEPPDELDYRIIDLPNVLATPHIAGATHEVEDHHVQILNDALSMYFVQQIRSGRKLANPEILQVLKNVK